MKFSALVALATVLGAILDATARVCPVGEVACRARDVGGRSRDVAVLLPRGQYDMASVCGVQGWECTSTFGWSAYGLTNLTNEELAGRIGAVANAMARVGAEVLQDSTAGVLFAAAVQPAAPEAQVAFSYDGAGRTLHGFAGRAGRAGRALKQFAVPTVKARVQLGAPYHLSALNVKQATICNVTKTRCQFRSDSYVFSGTGKGVRVYLLGEAIDDGHDEFRGGKVSPDSFVFPGYRVDEACSRWQGTHTAALVAGAYYGAAKDAELVSVAVKPGCRLVGKSAAIAEGLWWVAQHLRKRSSQAIVVIGAQVSVKQPDSVAVDIIEELVADLIAQGVPVVSGAGGARVDACAFTPDRLPDVLTVGAAEVVHLPTRMAARPWLESNAGPCLTLWAPGARIESAFAPEPDATAVYSSTAAAAALTAGVLAIMMERHPDDTLAVLRERLYNATSSATLIYSREDTVSNLLQSPVD